ncbi:hypothetical protein U9M48_003322 [Paspalum notatum var. saurae]|uniref:Uncharacterized protein n=1 Tax=Paspalum notatum var. saurae TaxID=547442 RepID=A0AAQ3PH79_PASNO
MKTMTMMCSKKECSDDDDDNDGFQQDERMFKHRRSKAASTSSGSLFQGISQSRERFQKCNSVRARPADSEKLLIRPLGQMSWDDVKWEGNKGPCTKINGVLGALCLYHYPGMVVVNDPVLHEYGQDDREAMKALKRHFSKSAEKVINDSLYNARITAVCHYYKSVKGEKMTKKKGANTIYLKEEEYLKTEVDWLVKDIEAWRWLAKLWSSPEWIEKSEGKRNNRGKDPGHKYGADGHFGLQRRMEAESGTSQSFMNDRYGQEMVKRHGEGVQWMQQPLDVDALYHSGEGRRHGKIVEYVYSDFSMLQVDDAQEEAREAREEARQAREEARQTREESQQAMAYMSTFMPGPQAWTPSGPAGIWKVAGVAGNTSLADSTAGLADATIGLSATYGVDATGSLLGMRLTPRQCDS